MIKRCLKRPIVMVFSITLLSLLSITILLIFTLTTKAIALDVTAASCSAADIQTAINNVVSAGGGTVYIPACQADNTWGSGDYISVTTNVAFRLKGAGMDSTVIGYQDGATRGGTGMFFGGTGLVELSGFTFRGSDTSGIDTGIQIYCNSTVNLRIHHMRIQKFKTTALYVCQNPDSPMVIDHNEIGDQYDKYMYGIRVHGTNKQSDFVIPASFGANNPNATFIEDNIFDGNYHSVSAFATSKIVFRYNTVRNPTSFVDGHGPCYDIGCQRGGVDPRSGTYIYEIYNNNFDSGGYSWCVNIRGGTGIVTDNTFTNCATGFRLEMESCSAGANCNTANSCPQSTTDTNACYQAPNQWWVWNNTNTNFEYNDRSTGCIRENQEYYLRAPQAGDPVQSYTKYSYPHPLTDPNAPTAQITSPTTSSTYTTTDTSINLSGTATDPGGTTIGITSVTWSNNATGSSGNVTLTSQGAATTDWTITGISLQSGQNTITVTATDGDGKTGSDILVVNPTTSSSGGSGSGGSGGGGSGSGSGGNSGSGSDSSYTSDSLSDSGNVSISGGGCGFVKDDNGKGPRAKGQELSLIMMLIMTLTGIAIARRFSNRFSYNL